MTWGRREDLKIINEQDLEQLPLKLLFFSGCIDLKPRKYEAFLLLWLRSDLSFNWLI